MHPIILEVLGLAENYTDNQINFKDWTGTVYVKLSDETPDLSEAVAIIDFDFCLDYEYQWSFNDYGSPSIDEIDVKKVIICNWTVSDVDLNGNDWTISKTDKAKIDSLITQFVLDCCDGGDDFYHQMGQRIKEHTENEIAEDRISAYLYDYC